MSAENFLPHILLVEDDEIDQENIKRAFTQNGILNPLHIANDGVEALNMLRGENGYTALNPTPKILLLDINMPKLNGLGLLKKLRESPEFHNIYTIVLTTSDSDKDITVAHDLNVAGYIVKPIEMSDFIRATAELKMYWSLQQLPT